MTILFAAALAAAQAPTVLPPEAGKALQCEKDEGAAKSVCLALAAQLTGRYDEAARQFEAAAGHLPAGDPAIDRALAAAGNMWIAAGEPGKAALALDRALAGGGLQAEQRGEALLDRARAAEAQNDFKTARARVEEAKQTISADPFLWYFSAALAIREGDVATARLAIGKALSLAPDDPTVLFEAGHVAHMAGDLAGARVYWTRAAAVDPKGRSGSAAREALALLDRPQPVQSQASPTK